MKNTSNGPGRPAYSMKWPRGRFTFIELMKFNGVNPKTGKGKTKRNYTTRLTVWNWLNKCRKGRNAFIERMEETADPKNGTGRRAYVYRVIPGLRPAKVAATAKPVTRKARTVVAKVTKVTRKPRTPKVTSTTADYEAQKAALLAPSAPVVAVKVEAPIVPTPEPSKVEPTPAPVETPKAEAPAIETPAATPEPALAGAV